ncbi:MAG: 3-phosphoshikimate 1-carboxyvinyltransferase [Bacteroidales bacterium]|nr:3-phosphoshikimate 1-carboxyvinyltransferase [Bacteroidales bacterium]
MQKILSSSSNEYNAGHAGTAMRFLTAYFSLIPGEVILSGSERMKNRPIGVLVDLLRELGANIEYLEKEGFPPLKISGGKLKGGKRIINGGISSQYISALLLIAPYLPGGLDLMLKGHVVSASYINLSLQLMKRAGIRYSWNKNNIKIEEGNYQAGVIHIEPDWSAASYWYEMAALSRSSEIFLPGLTSESLQGDVALVNLFDKLGVKTIFEEEGVKLIKTKARIDRLEFDFSLNPDLVQTFIPACAIMNIPFRFSGTQTLRIKETDRVLALKNEMQKFGVKLDFIESGEWIAWDGKSKFKPNPDVRIETYDDHRMALGFAPIALLSGEIQISDPMVVSKSYPSYWKDLEKTGFEIKEVNT